jgi:membrane protease YdiL (CAAX protease family)
LSAFAWFSGLILAGLAAIAAFTYPAWLLLHPHFDFPFHRIGERIGMLALLLGFVLAMKRLRLDDRASLGFGLPRRLFLREMGIGLGVGVASMAAVVGIMSALGLLAWQAPPPAALLRLVAAKALAGLAVALIEETFLRGAMHTGVERESGARAAVLLTALVYALTHFFAAFRIPADQVNAYSGLALLSGTLQLFAHPLRIADAFLCLFAVGVVLGSVRAATGNIAACIGLHAGWVWVMLVAHELTQPLRSAPGSFLLSRYDGFIGWLVLAWTVALGLALRRFYAGRGGCAMAANASSR